MNEQSSSPWDVFINLLAVIAVYASVYAAVSLIFSYINLAFPDPLDSTISINDSLRYAIAMLFVSFLVYCWSWRSIESDLAQNPFKRKWWLRTCPIYLTIFLAGLLLLGDLICLIYYYLGGELTSRFALKVASLALVAGSVLVFYRDALRVEPGARSTVRRVLGLGVTAVVAGLVVAGIAIAGSPTRARLAELDKQKVGDLDEIQTKIVAYWTAKGALPASLSDLHDSVIDFAPPKDPQSDAPYGYRAISATAFELCADFNLPKRRAAQDLSPWKRNDSVLWDHATGQVCFARNIDPKLHPPNSAKGS